MSAPVSRRAAAAWQLALQYLGIGISAAKNLLLVPVALRFIDLNLYGSWLASGAVVAMLAVGEAGLGVTLVQRMARAHAQRDDEELSRLAGTGMFLMALLAMLLSLLGWIVAPSVPHWINAAPEHQAVLTACVRLAACGVGLNLLFVNLSGMPLSLQRAEGASITRFVVQALELLFTLVLLYWLHDPRAFPLGILLSSGVGLAIGLVVSLRVWRQESLPRWRIALHSVRSITGQVLPLFVSRAAAQLALNSESTFTSALLTPSAAGLLTINARPFQVAQAAILPLTTASFTGLAHLAGGGDLERPRTILRQILGLSAAMATAMLPAIVLIHAGFIGRWVGAEYEAGPRLVLALGLSVLLVTRSQSLQFAMLAVGASRAEAIVSVVEPVVKIALLRLLLRPWGLVAVPFASCVSASVVIAVMTPLLGAKAWGLGAPHVLRLSLTGLLQAALALASTAFLWNWVAHAVSWKFLTLQALVGGCVYSAVACAAQPTARPLLLELWHRLRRRRAAG